MSATPRTVVVLPVSRTDASQIARRVIRPPGEAATPKLVRDLFGENYIPGTFMLSERKERPAFLWDEEDGEYEGWMRRVTRSHVEAIARGGFLPSGIDAGSLTKVEDAVLEILEVRLGSGRTLCDSVTNQQVTDIVWRILKTVFLGNPYASCHLLREVNDLGRRCATRILQRHRPDDPISALKWSVVAGAVGADIKARYTAAGPSPMREGAIIQIPGAPGEPEFETVGEEIERRATQTFGIDCSDDFLRDVIGKSGEVSLLFFTDDYVETVFDLWAILTLLREKQNLQVTIVPKWGQQANDASFEDVQELLADPLFEDLRAMEGVRFHVAPNGPAGSGISAYELSPRILEALRSVDVVLFKGARSFEMLQGVKKTAYFAFNVLHSYTETLTGLDATLGPSVLLRYEAGVPAFQDFRHRAERKATLASGRVVGLARMTALEYVEAIKSQQYARFVCEGQDRNTASMALVERAKALNKTFAQLTLDHGCLPTTGVR